MARTTTSHQCSYFAVSFSLTFHIIIYVPFKTCSIRCMNKASKVIYWSLIYFCTHTKDTWIYGKSNNLIKFGTTKKETEMLTGQKKMSHQFQFFFVMDLNGTNWKGNFDSTFRTGHNFMSNSLISVNSLPIIQKAFLLNSSVTNFVTAEVA